MNCARRLNTPADEHHIMKMVASTVVRVLIFLISFTHVSFGLQPSDSNSRLSINNLITTKIQDMNCKIPMNNSVFPECDRPAVSLDDINSAYFRDEIYLCMAVYDVVLHICILEKNNRDLSSGVQEVIKEMNGETKHDVYDAQNICNRMKTIKFEAANMELIPWISKLNSTLQIQATCEYTCTKGQEVNPLCIFVHWGNTLRAEPTVENENVGDINANTSKLSNNSDEKALNLQPSEKSLKQSKIDPSPVVQNTDTSLNEPDDNHSKLEEVTSKTQEDLHPLDDTNYEFTQEDQDNKSSDVPKISTSVETDTKQSQTTSSNEAVNNLETDTDATHFGDHVKGDTSSVQLPEPPTTAGKITSFTKNDELKDSALPSAYRKHFDNAEDSHFFAYFMTVVVICIIAYLIYHNKHKLLALILEGRRRREMRRRTTHGGYRKLDSSLEEAVTSTCSTSVTHVIY